MHRGLKNIYYTLISIGSPVMPCFSTPSNICVSGAEVPIKTEDITVSKPSQLAVVINRIFPQPPTYLRICLVPIPRHLGTAQVQPF